MNKSYNQIKTNVGAECQDSTSAFATIIGRFVNRRYFQILRAINWKNIRTDYSFNTISGTQNYVLPDDFGKEIACQDVTNDIQLGSCDLEELYKLYGSDLSTSGSIERYVIYDDVVQAQPSSASVLTIVSSSAADTTQTILVRGISSGVETYESVTLTGTSDALTTNSYTRIKGISKSAVTTGYVTVDSNSAAVTQAIIPKETLETRYKLIKLHYVPSGVATINLPYIIKPLPLSQTSDYPVMDCADLIELGALADCWRYKRQFGKAGTMEVLFNQELQAMIFDKENNPNQIVQFMPTTYDKNNLY